MAATLNEILLLVAAEQRRKLAAEFRTKPPRPEGIAIARALQQGNYPQASAVLDQPSSDDTK
jgi:hypothetical protein